MDLLKIVRGGMGWIHPAEERDPRRDSRQNGEILVWLNGTWGGGGAVAPKLQAFSDRPNVTVKGKVVAVLN
jgi:hypothetical protein